MTRYYISNPEAERGFEELTEAEWLGLIGEGEGKGEVTVDEVEQILLEFINTKC